MIYVVDDDESVRRSLSRLLRSAGLTVRAFASAEDLLESPDVDAAECAIVDVHMPGMNGLELQRVLARRTPPMPVVFVTAYDDAAVRAEAIVAGATAVLKKPFDDMVLLSAVSKAASYRRDPPAKEPDHASG